MPKQERYPDHQPYAGCAEPVLEGLDVLGGDVAEHCIVLAFGRARGERLTADGLYNGLRSMAGHTLADRLPTPEKITETAEKLRAIGAVDRITIRSRRKLPPTYALTEHGQEYILSLSGAMLSWQIINKDHQLQGIWNPEADRPKREYFALPRIIDAHVLGASVSGIQRALRNSAPLTEEVYRQQALGILDVNEKYADKKYLLFRPPTQDARFNFGDDKASWFFTEAADLLHVYPEGPHKTRMSEEFFISQIVHHNPGLNFEEVQEYLYAAMREERVSFIEQAEPKLRIRLSEGWQRPIQRLINRIVTLSEPERRALARQQAWAIGSTPKAIRMLMRRSQVIRDL